MDTLISDLIELPDQVRKGDFVLNLSAGVTRPEETLREYVVTPQLADCFDNALGFIRSALDARSSKAAYLHGSFGAGKSHYMAVLHILLEHNPQARSIPELAPVCVKHEWVRGKKFLLVPYHLIGARDLESAILGGYVDHVRRLHPQAPLPGVYLANEIFANAQQHREQLGDDKFFGLLNQSAAGSKWGAMDQGWTAASFEAALAAPPRSEARSRLVGDLVQHIFPAYRGLAHGKDEAYVPLDLGLSIISRHAQSLGYDALVLFLDELILWLASHAADLGFIHREGQKLAKLVESQTPDRPAPIVSFVARQRDLRELVGESITGAEQLNFADALKHWEGRFHMITLEDRNLPAIVEKRVVRPRNAACREQLDRAFEETTKVREEVMETLLTHEADRTMFRQVYPFSPALVQTLVAVSSALQRERTALKVMLQLLVEKRQELELGDIVPVGDLWDVVAHGEEAFTDVMRVQFENAKRLYHHKLRPMLEDQHRVNIEHDRQRARTNPELAERLAAFDTDDRLIKTLLLAALVPEVETLKDLTPSRLAALNHGTIRSPIPGREGQIVLNKLRAWAGIVGEIRVNEEPLNPTISIQLTGIDTESIIEAAKAYDNPGNRRRKVREMLFEAMGIAHQDELSLTHPFLWRGTKRACDILFANVRELGDESLRSKDDNWRLVIDFPFDTEGHDPIQDLQRVERFRAEQEGTRTLAWLPSFFSRKTQAELGKLVILDNLLRGENLDQFSRHLSFQERVTARSLLENQQSSLATKLKQTLEAAYAVREPLPGTIDSSHDLSDHVSSLWPGFTPQPPVGATLKDALEHLLGQALAHQFPDHPEFERDIKSADLRKVLDVAQRAAQTEDGRVGVDEKPLRSLVRQIANPLRLGTMSETHFVLSPEWRNHFNRQLAAAGKETPSVAELRQWINLPRPKGLPPEIENLLIQVYADQTNRTFFLHGGPFHAALDKMPGELELRQATLPPPDAWNRAVERAAAIFGLHVSDLLNAANVTNLAGKLREEATRYRGESDRLPGLLHTSMTRLGMTTQEIEKAARYRTATAVKALLSALAEPDPAVAIEGLAKAKMDSSTAAMGKSVKSASEVAQALRQTRWELFQSVSIVAKTDELRRASAQAILEDMRAALMADEYVTVAGQVLQEAEHRAIRLLTPVPAPPAPPPPRPTPAAGWKTVETGQMERLDASGMDALMVKLHEKMAQDQALRLSITWTLVKKEPS